MKTESMSDTMQLAIHRSIPGKGVILGAGDATIHSHHGSGYGKTLGRAGLAERSLWRVAPNEGV